MVRVVQPEEMNQSTNIEMVQVGTLPKASFNQGEFGMAGTADDQEVLKKMGYRQELYRGFNGLMSFAFCFTAVSVIPSISLGFNTSVLLGGPAEIVWSWVVGSIFCIICGLAMAEITSVYPSAGSVYHWAGQMGPVEWAPVSSYICGWFNFLGNFAGDAAFASAFGTFVNYSIMITNPDVSLTMGAQVGISILVLAVWTVMNISRTDQQGWLNNFAAFYQVAGSLVIMIVVLSMSPARATGWFVFSQGQDKTGILGNTGDGDGSTSSVAANAVSGYTVVLGITNCLFAFSGYEAGAHMAEETRDARRSAPWGIVGTVLCCAVFGFIYILGMVFAVPDITNTATGTPILDIYVYTAGTSGGLGLMILLIICTFFAGMSSTTVTSRIVFAMVRDGALPFSKFMYTVNATTKSPIRSVVLVFILDSLMMLLALINGDGTALAAVTGTAVVGFQISYAIPIILRITVGRKDFVPGVFNCGRFSFIVAWIAIIWNVATSIIFFWPMSLPTTSKNMNWTCVIVPGILVVAGVNWLFSARHVFVGPKRKHLETDGAGGMNPNEVSIGTPGGASAMSPASSMLPQSTAAGNYTPVSNPVSPLPQAQQYAPQQQQQQQQQPQYIQPQYIQPQQEYIQPQPVHQYVPSQPQPEQQQWPYNQVQHPQPPQPLQQQQQYNYPQTAISPHIY